MAASVKDLQGLPDWPRLLSREQLAAYLSVAEGTITRMISDGTLPGPVIDYKGCKRWDREEIDKRFDMLSGLTPGSYDDDPAIQALEDEAYLFGA